MLGRIKAAEEQKVHAAEEAALEKAAKMFQESIEAKQIEDAAAAKSAWVESYIRWATSSHCNTINCYCCSWDHSLLSALDRQPPEEVLSLSTPPPVVDSTPPHVVPCSVNLLNLLAPVPTLSPPDLQANVLGTARGPQLLLLAVE